MDKVVASWFSIFSFSLSRFQILGKTDLCSKVYTQNFYHADIQMQSVSSLVESFGCLGVDCQGADGIVSFIREATSWGFWWLVIALSRLTVSGSFPFSAVFAAVLHTLVR